MNAEGKNHPLYYSYQNHIKMVEDSLQQGAYSRAASQMIGTLASLHPVSQGTYECVDLVKKLNRADETRMFRNMAQLHERWYNLLDVEGYTSASIINIVLGGGMR